MMRMLHDIAESAHPEAALNGSGLPVRAEVERCCPAGKRKPACTYEPCPQPRPVGMPDLPKIGINRRPLSDISCRGVCYPQARRTRNGTTDRALDMRMNAGSATEVIKEADR